MQSVDMEDLDRLLSRWDSLLKTYPQAKGSLMERIGTRMLERVRENISASGMENGGGPLAAWQTYHVGSKHGYAAVRAGGSIDGYKTGKESPGAITKYTENGHQIRRPAQTAPRRYNPRIRVSSVRGFHYYHRVSVELESIGSEEILNFVKTLTAQLGGAA